MSGAEGGASAGGGRTEYVDSQRLVAAVRAGAAGRPNESFADYSLRREAERVIERDVLGSTPFATIHDLVMSREIGRGNVPMTKEMKVARSLGFLPLTYFSVPPKKPKKSPPKK
jgi:hypothetical protein